MVPMYHLITLNHMMATICKIIISPIFPITFFVCLAVRARARLSKNRSRFGTPNWPEKARPHLGLRNRERSGERVRRAS